MDAIPQSVERQLATAFRKVTGATVTAWGVDAKGNRCESWAADKIRVSIACLLSESGAEQIREQIAATGADVTVARFTGAIDGGPRSNRRQHRITCLMDDAAAQQFATVRLVIADEEITGAATVVKEAQDEYHRFLKQSGQGTFKKRCENRACPDPEFVTNWARSKWCSHRCRREVENSKARARARARKREQDATGSA